MDGEKCCQGSVAVYWGWVVCLSFLFLLTMCIGVTSSFSETIVPISVELNASLSLIALSGALPTGIQLLCSPIAIWLHSASGDRARLIVFTGVIISTTALVAMFFVENILEMFFLFGVLGGVGMLLCGNTPFLLINAYFPFQHPRHVFATSLPLSAFPIATLAFNPLAGALLLSIGWRLTYIVLAAMMFVIGSSACSTFRPVHQQELDGEIRAGLYVTPSYTAAKPSLENTGNTNLDNDRTDDSESFTKSVESDRLVERHSSIIDSATAVSPTSSALPKWLQVTVALLWFLASTFKAIGYYTMITFLVKQMVTLGISQHKAAVTMIIFSIFELVSRLMMSFFGDKCKGNILYMYIICSLALSIINLSGSFASTYEPLTIYAAALGFFGGPMLASMFASCSEVMDGQHVPALFGLFRAGLGCGYCVGSAVAGAIFDQSGSFAGVYVLNGIVYAASVVLYVFIKVVNVRQPVCFLLFNLEERHRAR